ncbi:MAG: ArnT family glycosyltransferase [Chloroflexota bacterium]
MAILFVIGVASFLRLFELDRVPLGLDLDEARDGLEAARILMGQHPIMFTTFDPREPVFFYTAAAFMAVFGHTQLALRLASVFWGLAAVGMTYALSRKWFGRWVAFLASLGLAASFWHLVESRWAIHSITFPPLVALFLLLFWGGFARHSKWSFGFAGIALALCVYAYSGGRGLPVLIVLLLAGQLLMAPRSVWSNWRGILTTGAVTALLILPLVIYFGTHPVELFARMGQVSIFGPPLPGVRPITLPESIVRTLGMFFISGDASWQKDIPYRPVFGWWLAIPFCVGVLWALFHVRAATKETLHALGSASGHQGTAESTRLYPCYWLVCALLVTLVPGFFSRPSPHFSRTVGAAPFTYMLLALGLAAIVQLAARRRPAHVGAAIGATALLVLLGFNSYREFFGLWAHANGTLRSYEYGQSFDSRFLLSHKIAPDKTFFFLGYDSGTSIRYLAPQYDASVWMEDFSQLVPFTSGQSSTYVFASPSLPLSPAQPSLVQRYFPHAEIIAQAAFPDGAPAARVLRVSGTQIRALQGAARPIGAAFNGRVVLESVSVGPRVLDVRPGQSVQLVLTWKMLTPSHDNYASFLHVVDQAGKVVAQDDRQGMASFGWKPGQQFLALHTVSLPGGLAPGRYRVLAGLDRRSTGGQPSRSLGQIAPPVNVLDVVVQK